MSRKITSIMQRLGALAIAMAMVFSMLLSGMTAKAAPIIGYDDDGTEITTGSLTIYKYVGDELDGLGDYPTQAELEEAIASAEGLEPKEDVVFSYLKVGEVAQGTDEDGNVTIGYSITNAELAGLLTGLDVAFSEGEEPSVTNYYTPKSLDTALSALTQTRMEKFMSDNRATEMTPTNEEGETTADNLPLGLYLIVETDYPATITRTTNPFFVSIPMTDSKTTGEEPDQVTSYEWIYDVKAYPKNSEGTIKIEKSVVEDGNQSWNIDGEIGQDKEFVIRADVPSAIGNMETYTITDTLSEGLTFNNTPDKTPVVRGLKADGTADTLLAETDYTFEPSGQVLTFKFTPSQLAEEQSGQLVGKYIQIEITYTAYLNEKAVVGGTGNVNDVELEYSTSTGSGSGTTTATPTDDPAIYTYAIDLLKYGDGDEENKLEGVQFELHDSSYDPSNPSGSKIQVAQSTDQSYYYVIGNNTGTDTPITTNSDGKIDLRGLEAGTYYLVETKTVGDYNLLSEAIEIVITSNEGRNYSNDVDGVFAKLLEGVTDYYTDSSLETKYTLPEGAQAGDYVNFGNNSVWYNNGGTPTQVQMEKPGQLTWHVTVGGNEVISDGTAIGDGKIEVNVNNSTGFQLPATGGSGTILFTVIGGILIIGAVALLYKVSRKKNGTDAGAAE